MTDRHLEAGAAVAARLNPTLHEALSARYDGLLPGMADSLIEWAYGHHYARPGLDLKTRQLCTVAALAAMGGGTAPQLRVNVAHALAAGASRTEITEAIEEFASLPAWGSTPTGPAPVNTPLPGPPGVVVFPGLPPCCGFWTPERPETPVVVVPPTQPAPVPLPDTLGFMIGVACILIMVALFKHSDDLERIR